MKYLQRFSISSVFHPLLTILILSACSPDAPPVEPPLHEAAPFPVGFAAGYKMLHNDTLMSIAGYEFNSVTAENEMKMYGILRNGDYDFSRADEYIQYAEKNNMRMFGHALIWHYGAPQKVKALEGDSAGLWNFTRDYIDTVVTRYKGKIDAWDVVNEAILDKTGELRENLWLKALGPDYIEMAFQAAHEADPGAKLFLNDYNIERDSAKLEGFLQLVKDLHNKEVPIHGIGLQMHIRMDTPEEVIQKHLKKCVETGLLIHLSELDIIFNKHNDSKGGGENAFKELTPEMKEQQAQKYRRIAQIYIEVVPAEQRYGITLWGFTDRHTWVRGFFEMMDWPLLFDDDLKKKPAYFGFREGLRSGSDIN